MALCDDIADIRGWRAPAEVRNGVFWMGPRGTNIPIHHELTNGLTVQIAG